jgi:hypothetical protein
VLDCSGEFPSSSLPATEPRVLTEADAVEIWIARWLRVRPKSLLLRYRCDSRRLYEIWWGERFPGSRAKAETLFRERYPGMVERTSFGYRRIPAVACKSEGHRQLKLFD